MVEAWERFVQQLMWVWCKVRASSLGSAGTSGQRPSLFDSDTPPAANAPAPRSAVPIAAAVVPPLGPAAAAAGPDAAALGWDAVAEGRLLRGPQDPCLPGRSLLDGLLLAYWEDAAGKGLFRYDVTACPTRVLPGHLGFVAQLNEGRATTKRPTEFKLDEVGAGPGGWAAAGHSEYT